MNTATATTARIPGTAGRLVHWCADRLAVADLYGPDGSRLYDALVRDDQQEVVDLLRLLGGYRGPVLDLACGSGRFTLPLLARGLPVLAVDLSPSMLELLRARAAQLPAPLSRRLSIECADMADLHLPQRFGLIVLGASSVSLLDGTGRARLFDRVREHLTADGRFVFSTLEFEASRAGESTTTVVLPDDAGPLLVTMFEHLDPDRRIRTVSLLRLAVAADKPTPAELFTSQVHVIALSTVESELTGAGLRVTARHERGGCEAGGVYRRMVTLECGIGAGVV